MAQPAIDMKALFESGAHLGHSAWRWNPKMRNYLFGKRDGMHIIDLSQTVPLLKQALEVVRQTAAADGRILFVGTRQQIAGTVAEAASRCSQYSVTHRWLGGMLTNWRTVTGAIKRLDELEAELAEENSGFTKKEMLQRTRMRDKLERMVGGVRKMAGLPNLMIVIDTTKETIAIAEAWKLRIPVVAILDSNSNPERITYPVPGNDDSNRAVSLYCDLFARAALDGMANASRQDAQAQGIEAADEAPEDKADAKS